jgi:hypothetical protein
LSPFDLSAAQIVHSSPRSELFIAMEAGFKLFGRRLILEVMLQRRIYPWTFLAAS